MKSSWETMCRSSSTTVDRMRYLSKIKKTFLWLFIIARGLLFPLNPNANDSYLIFCSSRILIVVDPWIIFFFVQFNRFNLHYCTICRRCRFIELCIISFTRSMNIHINDRIMVRIISFTLLHDRFIYMLRTKWIRFCILWMCCHARIIVFVSLIDSMII